MILHLIRQGDAASTPLILLHGLFGSAGNWGRIQRRLAQDRPVLAMDLRNHGTSPHDPIMDYPTMAADVAETMAAAGIARAAVVGHSMGGKVAMQLALRHPTRVTRLVVADIAPVAYPPHFRTIAATLRDIPLAPGLTRAEADRRLAEVEPDPAVRGFLLQNLRFGATPAWRIGLDEIGAALPAIEEWQSPPGATFEGPVLILRGERSRYIQPEHRPLFRALFPHARMATLRDAGHWLHADAPDAFLRTVQDFVTPAASAAPLEAGRLLE